MIARAAAFFARFLLMQKNFVGSYVLNLTRTLP